MAQQQVDADNARLGMPVHVRSGHTLLEAWSAGSAFREHDRRVHAAQQRRKELEDQKKEVSEGGGVIVLKQPIRELIRRLQTQQLTRLKKDAAKTAAGKTVAALLDDGFPRPSAPSSSAAAVPAAPASKRVMGDMEHAEKTEILALNLNALKAEDEDLMKEIVMLDRQRNTHVRWLGWAVQDDRLRNVCYCAGPGVAAA